MTDVLIVGAGLAGLRAASVLRAADLEVRVLEGSCRAGGRIATDSVDGFLLDRGFALVNPAYPELRSAIDVDALALQRFGRGVAVATDAGQTVLADPLRHRSRVGETLGSGIVTPRDAVALARWFASRGRDRDLRGSLDAAGVTGQLRAVLDGFLSGVLADTAGVTSAAFARTLVGFFLRGTPGVPRAGMGHLAELLAEDVAVEIGRRVTAVEPGERPAVVVDGERLGASAVIVATDPTTAGELTGAPVRPMRGLTTWWFAPDAAPVDHPFIVVDGIRGRGPVVNTCVMTNAAPGHAPAGRHLVQASTVLDDLAPSEADVRAHVGLLYGTDAAAWPLLRRDVLPHALPDLRAGWQPGTAEVTPGVHLAGDHIGGASINGALASGRRTAETLLAARAGHRHGR
ncbi:FAD-dependent oxidoreductase [Propioniciclava soli]|uniref:FAD-dependent oxidoreductase n=1 Tax=Propioniciclava soli TaxID=2775081 RepID=A0ABZ3C7J6_9ACTN